MTTIAADQRPQGPEVSASGAPGATVNGSARAPSSVAVAVVLIAGAAVLQTLLVVTGATAPLWDGAWSAGSLTMEQARPILLVGLVLGAAWRLLVAALLAVMALAVRAGRGWPRVALLLVAGLGVASLAASGLGALVAASLPGATGGGVLVVTLTVQLVVLGLEVTAAVLLLRDPAGRWFRARAAQRRIAASSPA